MRFIKLWKNIYNEIKNMSKNKSLLILGFIIFLAVGLRLFPVKDLTRGSIGKVDAFILNDSAKPLSVLTGSLPINQGPIKYYLMHFLLYLGRDEFIILALPFIFGIASIPLLYYLGILFFDKKTALLACFFLSVSCWHINHSMMVRNYTLYSFLVLSQVIFFWRIIRYNRVRDCCFFVLACYLAFHSFYTTIFIVIAEILWVIFYSPKKIGFSNFKKIIFSLFLFFVLISSSMSKLINIYIYQTSPTHVMEGQQAITKVFRTINSFGGIKNFLPLGILIFLFSLFLLLYKKKKSKETAFIFIIFFIPIVIYGSCLIFFKMKLLERYFLFLYPFFLLISAAGIMYFRKNSIKIILSFVFVLPLILLLLSAGSFKTGNYIPHDYKKRYKDYISIASMIEEKSNDVDYVFVAPWTTIYPIQYYLDKSNKNPVKTKLCPYDNKYYPVHENDFIKLFGVRAKGSELFLLKQLYGQAKIMVIDINFSKRFRLARSTVNWLNEHSSRINNLGRINLYFVD